MARSGIKSGTDFGDFGHYEWGGQKFRDEQEQQRRTIDAGAGNKQTVEGQPPNDFCQSPS